jgi:hypothetical protein
MHASACALYLVRFHLSQAIQDLLIDSPALTAGEVADYVTEVLDDAYDDAVESLRLSPRL